MQIFCELRSRGEEKYEQWAKCPLVLYAKPSNKRFIIPLQKIVKNILIPSVGMMLTMSKILSRIICETIEWEVNYSTAKKNVILASIFIIFSSASSSSSAIVALFASAGIRPVVNRLKQDTTVYYVTASYFARSLNLIWYNDVMVE